MFKLQSRRPTLRLNIDLTGFPILRFPLKLLMGRFQNKRRIFHVLVVIIAINMDTLPDIVVIQRKGSMKPQLLMLMKKFKPLQFITRKENVREERFMSKVEVHDHLTGFDL